MDKQYPIELNEKNEWELNSVWLACGVSTDEIDNAKGWIKKAQLPVPPEGFYIGQTRSAKYWSGLGRDSVYNIIPVRVERITATYYSWDWHITYECRKMNHGHTVYMYNENFKI